MLVFRILLYVSKFTLFIEWACVLIGDVFSFLYSLSRNLIDFIMLSHLIFYVYVCYILLFYLLSVFFLIAQLSYELCCNLRRGQRLDADQVMQLRLNP